MTREELNKRYLLTLKAGNLIQQVKRDMERLDKILAEIKRMDKEGSDGLSIQCMVPMVAGFAGLCRHFKDNGSRLHTGAAL